MSFERDAISTEGDSGGAVRERDAASPPERTFARAMFERAREAAGTLSAPIWLWSCTHVGARPRTLGRPRILNRGLIEIRDGVVIDSRFSRTEIVTSPGGRIVIGSGTSIEHGVMLVASRLVELGDGVTLGAYSIVSDSDSPDLVAGAVADDAQPIWIGDDVVIGARVTVLPGAIIGARTHVLPGSIVSGEIPPGVIAGGNPARPVRKLRPPVSAGLATATAAMAPAALAVTSAGQTREVDAPGEAP